MEIVETNRFSFLSKKKVINSRIINTRECVKLAEIDIAYEKLVEKFDEPTVSYSDSTCEWSLYFIPNDVIALIYFYQGYCRVSANNKLGLELVKKELGLV